MRKQILKTFLIVGVFLAVPGFASAAPAVNNISGVIAHDSMVTVNGTNFGIKIPAAPLLKDDFSRGTPGQPLSSGVGSPWTTQVECVGKYSNAMAYGRSHLSAEQMLTRDDACWTRTRARVLGEQTQLFFSYRYYVAPNGTGSITKMGRVGCNDDVHCTPNMGYTAFSPNYWYAFAEKYKETVIARVFGIEGQWIRDDTWTTLSQNDVANGTVGVWRNGVQQSYSATIMTKSANSMHSNYNQVFLPYYNEAGDRTVYIGDVYIDNTLARIEVCTGSTWLSRGDCEIQIPTAWSANAVSIIINQGSFADNSTKYLYVVDSNGEANTAGFGIFFGDAYSISSLLTLITNWLKAGTVSDVNSDGAVNVRDLGIMMSKWGN